MYSKLVVGLAMAGAATAAQIVKRDGGHGGGGHDHGHAHAAPAPADGYGAPAASYGAPAPAASYGAPAQSYSAPSTGYGQEASYGYEEESDFDLTVIIIPLLILVGLSLLFPGIVSVEVDRKKRAAGEEAANPLADVVERVNDIYSAVVESEECMQRIACEIGGIAGDVGIKQTAKLADPFVPSKYKAYYKQFTTGQNCHKIKCGSIF